MHDFSNHLLCRAPKTRRFAAPGFFLLTRFSKHAPLLCRAPEARERYNRPVITHTQTKGGFSDVSRSILYLLHALFPVPRIWLGQGMSVVAARQGAPVGVYTEYVSEPVTSDVGVAQDI